MTFLSSLDRSLFLGINSLHAEWLNTPMLLLSGQIIWLPVIFFTFWKAYKENSRKEFYFFGLFLLMAIIASDVTASYIFKNIFTRLRPCREADLLPLIHQFGQKCGGRFGFVSSHAANSCALVMFSISSLPKKTRWWILFWLMPILVSYSRIYLGVHYPGDLLVGSFIGLFWGAVFAWCFRKSKAPV